MNASRLSRRALFAETESGWKYRACVNCSSVGLSNDGHLIWVELVQTDSRLRPMWWWESVARDADWHCKRTKSVVFMLFSFIEHAFLYFWNISLAHIFHTHGVGQYGLTNNNIELRLRKTTWKQCRSLLLLSFQKGSFFLFNRGGFLPEEKINFSINHTTEWVFIQPSHHLGIGTEEWYQEWEPSAGLIGDEG